MGESAQAQKGGVMTDQARELARVVYFDCNIFDKVAVDTDFQQKLRRLVEENLIRVIVTPVVAEELKASPFGGVPEWFRVDVVPEAVAVSDRMRAGMARSSVGAMRHQHLGDSRNDSRKRDSIWAHSADALADVLVSEDKISRSRLGNLSERCKTMTFDEFREWIMKGGA